jgi:hypothetical protein
MSEVSAPTDSSAPARSAAGLRLRGAAVGGSALAILALAWALDPAPAGYGTHRQLGLPGCRFLAETGYPCPTCGMTTSVSAAARGRLAAAWYAHPAGLAIVAGLLAALAVGGFELVTGADVLRRVRPRPAWALVVAAVVLGGWAWMLLSGLAGGRWPSH